MKNLDRVYLGDSVSDTVFEEISDLFWDMFTAFPKEPDKMQALCLAVIEAQGRADMEEKLQSIFGDKEPDFVQKSAQTQLVTWCYDADNAKRLVEGQAGYSETTNMSSALQEIRKIAEAFAIQAIKNIDQISTQLMLASVGAQGQDQAFTAYSEITQEARTIYMEDAVNIKGQFTQAIIKGRAEKAQQQKDVKNQKSCCVLL